MIPACFVKRYPAEANPHRQREIRSHNGTIPLMGAIVPRNLGYYSYARTGYANPHAVKSVGGTNSRNKGERSRR